MKRALAGKKVFFVLCKKKVLTLSDRMTGKGRQCWEVVPKNTKFFYPKTKLTKSKLSKILWKQFLIETFKLFNKKFPIKNGTQGIWITSILIVNSNSKSLWRAVNLAKDQRIPGIPNNMWLENEILDRLAGLKK